MWLRLTRLAGGTVTHLQSLALLRGVPRAQLVVAVLLQAASEWPILPEPHGEPRCRGQSIGVGYGLAGAAGAGVAVHPRRGLAPFRQRCREISGKLAPVPGLLPPRQASSHMRRAHLLVMNLENDVARTAERCGLPEPAGAGVNGSTT